MKRFLESNWSQIAPRLKEKYHDLSDGDLEWVEGNEDKFLRRLERKLELPREEVIREMKDLITIK